MGQAFPKVFNAHRAVSVADELLIFSAHLVGLFADSYADLHVDVLFVRQAF